MGEYLQAFALGNAAILGNVCMLPLYPGLFVLLADRMESGAPPRTIRWMGLLVLAGVLTAILVAVFSQNRRLKEDSIIGVFFVAAFALGIVVISASMRRR